MLICAFLLHQKFLGLNEPCTLLQAHKNHVTKVSGITELSQVKASAAGCCARCCYVDVHTLQTHHTCLSSIWGETVKVKGTQDINLPLKMNCKEVMNAEATISQQQETAEGRKAGPLNPRTLRQVTLTFSRVRLGKDQVCARQWRKQNKLD